MPRSERSKGASTSELGWRDAWRLTDVAFLELSLQAIYASKQGNLPPPIPAAQVARQARSRVVQSKAIVATVLALLVAGACLLMRAAPRIVATPFFGVPVSIPVFQAGVLCGLLTLEVAFLWWTGLQVLPTFLASAVLPVLEPLPIDERTLGRVAGLLYLRLFDLPAITVIVVTPLFVALTLGPVYGLAILPGAAAAVSFALALGLLTGRFFVRRVQGSRGGGGHTIVRWAYLVLWVLPAFAMFGLIVVAPGFLALIANTTSAGPTPSNYLLAASFPFSLAALPGAAANGAGVYGLDATGATVLVAASIGYLALAIGAMAWLLGAVRRVGLAPPLIPASAPAARYDLVPQTPALAVLTKDLRIASRMPGYAFLVILPILDAAALGLFTFISGPAGSTTTFGLALAAVSTAALLATFFGPAFFATEVIAYSYGRTLPLSDRSILIGKVALVVAIYLVASALVLGLTLFRVFQPVVFVAFIAAELPAVTAASFLELGILFRRAQAKGLPIVNLYSGAWIAVLVSIPGILVAGAPLVAFEAVGGASSTLGFVAMAAFALGELAICAPFALGIGGG
jgi:predicted permease